jgi:hypothetical protein
MVGLRRHPEQTSTDRGTVMVLGLMVVALLVARPRPVRAQSTAMLTGRVIDTTGGAIAGAEILVSDRATGQQRSTRTDGTGTYLVASLPSGSYRAEARATGFATSVIETLVVDVARAVVQDFRLNVGAVQQELTVPGDGALIERSTISVGHVIDSGIVKYVPLNRRQFIELGLLVPGSVTPPQNAFLSAPTRGQGSQAMFTAGNREDTVNFQVNGINLNDQVNNILVFQPTMEAIEAFKIDNSTLSAEYGRNSGAVVNISTRSGTSQFRGAVFDYVRNQAFDARNYFDSVSGPKAAFSRHQFGGHLGGPLPKDTFFFFSFEGVRQRQDLNVNSVVLSELQRASVNDPVVRQLIERIPRTNVTDDAGTSRFVGTTPAPVEVDQWALDVTRGLGRAGRLHAFYALQDDHRPEPPNGSTLPGFGDVRTARRQILTLNGTQVLGRAIVNEARFGFNRIDFEAVAGARLNQADYGIRAGVDDPIGLPQIIVPGAFSFGGPAAVPQGRNDSTIIASDTVSYLRGTHVIKAGGEFRYFINDGYMRDPGTFNFPNVASFIQGVANAFSVVLGDRSSRITQQAVGLFVQDSYRVRPRLTFELGLRYDLHGIPTERDGRFVIFDAATASLLQIGTDAATPFAQDAGTWQPRVGFTWDPFGGGRTSVRAAYAIQAEQPMTNVVTSLRANPPLATPLSVTGPVRLDNAIDLARAAGLAPVTVDPGYDNSATRTWNVNVQRELTRNIAIMAGYIGSRGRRLRLSRNINQPVDGVRPFAALSASSPLLPGRPLGNITQIESSGQSSYNALWLSATRRLSSGWQFTGSYTLSTSKDYNSFSSPPTAITVQNGYDLRDSWGPSDFDARHRLVASAVFELPFHANRFVDGWQLSGVIQAQSGNPVNIVTASSAVNGVPNTVRPDQIGPIAIPGQVSRWFDTTAVVAVNRFGTLPRNVVIGPRFDTTDVAVTKSVMLTEGSTLQLRAETFNLFNHPNFGQPGRIVASPDFGRITSTRFPTGDSGSSRQMQFSARFEF